MIHNTIRIQDLLVRHGSNLLGLRIRDHNTIQIHGFAKPIHVFTNLLYDSRILSKYAHVMLSVLSGFTLNIGPIIKILAGEQEQWMQE